MPFRQFLKSIKHYFHLLSLKKLSLSINYDDNDHTKGFFFSCMYLIKKFKKTIEYNDLYY